MLWVIFTVIIGLVFAGAVLGFIGNDKGSEGRFTAGIVAAVCIGAFVVLTIATSLATLGTGQVGLQYSFAGKLTGVKDQPGVIWKAPWTHIAKESVQIQRESFILDESNAAVTKDQQEITANLAINYEVDPKHVVDLYRTVGPSWKAKLIDSRVLQDFKEITATYPTIQITNSREQLRQETRERLKKELTRYSVTVTDFFIQNIGFSKAYRDAITAKQVQVQQAQQAEAKVAQATAEAQQVVAHAEGEAKAISIQGRALRDNPEVLKLRAIEKLNPKAQIVFCSSGDCPSFLGSLTATGK